MGPWNCSPLFAFSPQHEMHMYTVYSIHTFLNAMSSKISLICFMTFMTFMAIPQTLQAQNSPKCSFEAELHRSFVCALRSLGGSRWVGQRSWPHEPRPRIFPGESCRKNVFFVTFLLTDFHDFRMSSWKKALKTFDTFRDKDGRCFISCVLCWSIQMSFAPFDRCRWCLWTSNHGWANCCDSGKQVWSSSFRFRFRFNLVKTKEPRLDVTRFCVLEYFGRWSAKDWRHAPLACSDWTSLIMTRFGFHFFRMHWTHDAAARLGVPVGPVGNEVVRVYRPSTRTLILGNSHNDFPDSQASPSEAWRKEWRNSWNHLKSNTQNLFCCSSIRLAIFSFLLNSGFHGWPWRAPVAGSVPHRICALPWIRWIWRTLCSTLKYTTFRLSITMDFLLETLIRSDLSPLSSFPVSRPFRSRQPDVWVLRLRLLDHASWWCQWR